MIRGLPEDGERREFQLVLDLLDEARTTALLNRTLGTHASPREWHGWPMEFVQTVIGWAAGPDQPTKDDD